MLLLLVLLVTALLLLLDLVEQMWFRFLVYPKLLGTSLGYTKSRNHDGKLLSSPASQVLLPLLPLGYNYDYYYCYRLLYFLAGLQNFGDHKWFRLLVYPKLFNPSLGYTGSRNHICELLWSCACLNSVMV